MGIMQTLDHKKYQARTVVGVKVAAIVLKTTSSLLL